MQQKKKILYIEDDPGSQALVLRILSHAGYKVVVASRGLEGIELAVREQPDLILMDINLPDLSGREVTTRLRGDKRFDQIPIVALTAQSQAGEREKALVAGLTGYMTKPIDIDTLEDQVERYLGGAKDTSSPEALNEAQKAYNTELVARLEGKIRELEIGNAELRRMDKVKEDFIQLTAHELRTPMTLMTAYSRLMQDSSHIKRMREDHPETKQFLDGLSDSVERMAALINEIVTISRIASGRIDLSIGPIHLTKVLEKIKENYVQAARGRNQTLTLDTRGIPNLVQGDSDLLTLAFSNVVSNAIKYTPDGGTVHISGKTVGTNFHLMVKDTGIGIPKEDIKRIFEAFFTGNNAQLHSTSKTAFRGGGLGIGLSICRGIVEAHGGRIWAESDGRDERRLPGSIFHIELPIQNKQLARQEVKA
jgi:signal transduction histidine kinase